jgi:hypothetical protein
MDVKPCLHIREEYILSMLEKIVPRRIFIPKKEELTRVWRELHKEELHNSYSSPNNIIVTCTMWA